MRHLRTIGLLVGVAVAALAAQRDSAARPQQTSRLWRDVAVGALGASAIRSGLEGRLHRPVIVDRDLLNAVLRSAPDEFTPAATQTPVELDIPWPDGTFKRFRIENSPIMESGLAQRMGPVMTLRGQGIDDPTASARFDWTEFGFHAFVLSAEGTVYVDPATTGDTEHYLSYFRRDYVRPDGNRFTCGVSQRDTSQSNRRDFGVFQVPHGTTLRTYRTVVAATREYTTFHGGTIPLALAAITTSINRVNAIYERDLSVRMTLIANNDAVIYTAEPDPFSNNNGGVMLSQNQTTLDTVIGSANYDIGHVFSTGGGGVAFLGVVCEPGSKAGGVTGLSSPINDAFDVDYVAHEIGHQFGANHTFNGTTSSCGGGNRSATHAYEPGSGSTIMAYAGICGAENLQPHSDPYFHADSQNAIINFITSTATCAVQTATGNTPPVVSAGLDFTIPAQTPFTLTATGNDVDGDAMTYDWEEFDLGTASPPNTDNGSRPIFRSFNPVASPSRTFPKLPDILNNVSTFGESLPTTTRSMKFTVTARDNRLGGGGTSSDDVFVTVTSTAGPFTVTAPNTAVSWPSASTQTVAWNVANTNAAPVSAANVRILLSTDGGQTFPFVLAASTPNDGSHDITVPSTVTSTARIKVEAVGNIFFDVSNVNFTVTLSVSTTLIPSPGALVFGATKDGPSGALVSVTPSQTVMVTYTGSLTAWAAFTSAPWLQITNSAGAGAGQFSVAVVNPGNVIAGQTSLSATVSLSSPTALTVNIPVTLSVQQTTSTSLAPFGQVETPAQSAVGLQGAFGISGWALDDVGLATVAIYRNCLVASEPAACATSVVPGAPSTPVSFIGNAVFVPGARPDVEAGFPTAPLKHRAGWGLLVLSNMLPRTAGPFAPFGGQGPLTFYAIATDQEGKRTLLGRVWSSDSTPTSVTIDNDAIARPFGTIDLPEQGSLASGAAYGIFGWALTPDSNLIADGSDILIPVDGSQTAVFIDGVNRGNVTYNQCRGTVGNPVPGGQFCNDDVASIFGFATPQPPLTPRVSNPTRFRNLDAGRGPQGSFVFDMTSLTNGMHSIAWSVTDNFGRVEGIGSRNFFVLTSGVKPEPQLVVEETTPAKSAIHVSARTGFDPKSSLRTLKPRADGVRAIALPLLGRAELAFGAPVSAGYSIAGGQQRDLPIGSTLDRKAGVFAWAPAPGYLGTYRLVFEVQGRRVEIDVTVR